MTIKFFSMAVLLCAFVCCIGQTGLAQEQPSNTPKPKIMVIPKVKAGEEMKALYDSSPNIRIAIAKIEEALLLRRANLVSFDAQLKQVVQNVTLNRTAGNQEDYRTLVLQTSGADVYVEAEVNVVRHTQSGANSVSVILGAYQNGTSNLLGVKEGRSRINMTEDVGLLTSLALDTISEGFLNLIQLKWDDIRENGQSIFVQFTVSPSAAHTFDDELGNPAKMLSESIDEWFEKNTVHGVYNNQGVTTNMLIISDARIPLKDPADKRRNYTGQRFFTDINKFLRSLGLQSKREIGTNNKIIITIL